MVTTKFYPAVEKEETPAEPEETDEDEVEEDTTDAPNPPRRTGKGKKTTYKK